MGSTVRLIVALTITCLGSALALAAINSLTEEPIQEQKQLATMRAIKEVLPPFDNDPVAATRQIRLAADEAGADTALTVYLGIKEGQISGVAFRVFGEGYGGLIYAMVGTDLQGQISGVKILEHQETPGLGAKIEELAFTDQFKGKSLDNSVLVNGLIAVKNDGGDLDALTGATISPRGVAQAASACLKILARHGDEILQLPQSADSTGAAVEDSVDQGPETETPEIQ